MKTTGGELFTKQGRWRQLEENALPNRGVAGDYTKKKVQEADVGVAEEIERLKDVVDHAAS